MDGSPAPVAGGGSHDVRVLGRGGGSTATGSAAAAGAATATGGDEAGANVGLDLHGSCPFFRTDRVTTTADRHPHPRISLRRRKSWSWWCRRNGWRRRSGCFRRNAAKGEGRRERWS